MDELEISGKRYISTRRAGNDHHYHADYIGQLIRAKKVEGRKIGRAWYVDADSLATYLGKEAQSVRRPVVPPPAPVKEIIAEVAEEEVAEDIVEEAKEEAPIIYRTTKEAREATLGLHYVPDESPLIPQIKKIKEEHMVAITRIEPQPIPVRLESVKPLYQLVHQPAAMAPIMKFAPATQKSAVLVWVRFGEVLIFGTIVFVLASLLSAHLFFTLTLNGGQSADVGYSLK